MINILQFEGTDKYIIGLCQNENENENKDEDKKYYLFFAKIESISVNSGFDDDFVGRKYVRTSYFHTLQFELMKNLNNNSVLTTIEVSSVEEYEKIVKVVKLLL